MNAQLFKGELVRLVAEDLDVMAKAISHWALDSEYSRLFASDPCRLWSKNQTGEWLEKELGTEKPDLYIFMIRAMADDRLIGVISLDGIQYAQGDAFASIGVGERDFWGKGYGTDAMRLLLRFAFTELNLRRVTLDVFEYNGRAVHSYEKAGFLVEGRMRAMLKRAGKRWDMLFMGILREEWQRQFGEET
jgi:RimJ/RimL family protein N-acetyltransferase